MSIRENNKTKTRKNLLKSARHLFRSKGYDETMMSEIAASAEVSDATLYNYFPTKKDLLIGIARNESEELNELIERENEASTSADERIRKLMITHVRDVLSYVSLARRVVFVCAGLNIEDSIYADINELLFSLLEQGKEEGIFKSDMDSRDIVCIIYGLYYVTLFDNPMIEKNGVEKTTERFSRLMDTVLAEICLKN